MVRILVSVIGLLLAAGCPMVHAEEQARPRCDNCGMYTDTSSTNIHATFRVDGKDSEHNFLCLSCVSEFAKSESAAKLTSLKVVDFSTFGTDDVKWIDGSKAWYLVGTKDLPGSMAPMIAAFATKGAAKQASKSLGGDLMNFKQAWATFDAQPGDDSDGGHDMHSGHHGGSATDHGGGHHGKGGSGGCCG